MEASNHKASPFPPASDVPLHRNPPLAPSQEMAYRNKCVQLKRRLNEIEANNDATRKRIITEKERVQKMRLLRAILLNQLKEIMSVSGKSLTSEQLNRLGIKELAEPDEPLAHPEGETFIDDSSDASEDEDIPEPSERPTRMRRTNNSYREPVLNTNPKPATGAPTSYSQSNLPNLAPAGLHSPTAASREAGQHNSSFYVGSTPLAAGSPAYSQQSAHPQQQYAAESHYAQHSSPIQQHQSLYPHESNGIAQAGPPIHPDTPFVQFQNHMRPQLEADNYPLEQIESRIDEEWKKLSDENRDLWQQRYHEQMLEYQQDLDVYNRARRKGGSSAAAADYR